MKIKLRALEPSDIDLLYNSENEQDLWYLGNVTAPFSRYHLEQYILSTQSSDIYAAKQLRLMIDHIHNDNISTVGMIDLFDFDPHHRRAGVGILIASEYQNKGFARAALLELIAYAFNILQLNQLFCDVPIENERSLTLFQKHGFEITGIKKEWLFVKNEKTDVYFLQLLRNSTTMD